jgi:hypothetical protein
MNSSDSRLKENVYFVFVCTMTRVPGIIVGNSGCSKSLAYSIFIEVFGNNRDNI